MLLRRAVVLAICAALCSGRASAEDWEQSLSRMVFGQSPKPPARDRLVLTFRSRTPYCALSYPDGAAFRDFAVVGYHCDFLRAFVEKEIGADNYFNGTSPQSPHLALAGQLQFLRDTRALADAYYASYLREAARAVKLLEPKGAAPKASESSLKTLLQRQQKAYLALNSAIYPFLWPPNESHSYLRPSSPLTYARWQVYLDAPPGLAAALRKNQAEIDAAERGLVDGVAQTVRADLKDVSGPRPRESAAAALAALNRVFDGSRAAASDLAVVALGPGSAKNVRFTGPAQRPPSDIRSAAPPITIPDDDATRAQRNYFARGAVAGAQRLKDDARLQFRHATGASYAVGNPAWKAAFIVQQVNGTCGIGAQYEALRARGAGTTMPALTRVAADHGWYSEFRTAAGDGGGTVLAASNALLLLYHVRSRTIVNTATEDQLQQSIRTAGDAIITVRARDFWEDPSVPASSTHNVYVSGMEVGVSGKVLGYYVNDTGSGEAARFVSAARLRASWTKTLVQMLPNPSKPPPRTYLARS